ncbi:MAG: hypothetical protein FJX71_00560 [Alphaproteobacteria bacterium]|nr:hypothetical protein [Alphaproteobacteria bacterium]
MHKRKIYCLFLVILAFYTLPVLGIDDTFKREAEEKLPLKIENSTYQPINYTFMELYEAFSPLMSPKVEREFNDYFSILFDDNFPKAPHSVPTILEGYRCLYAKMKKAQGLDNKEARDSEQLKGLMELMALHKKAITGVNPSLGSKIEEFPCESCKTTAKASLGFQTHTGYGSPSAK